MLMFIKKKPSFRFVFLIDVCMFSYVGHMLASTFLLQMGQSMDFGNGKV